MAGALDRAGVAISGRGEWQGLLLWMVAAVWLFMATVVSLDNWTAAALQALSVLGASRLVSFPTRRGVVAVGWGLCTLSFGISCFLLWFERELQLSWSAAMVWLAHLVFAFLLLWQQGKDEFVRGNEVVLLRCAVALSVFCICFINVSSTFLNQWHVALVETFTVVAVLFLLKFPAPRFVGLVPLLVLFALSIVISNLLAVAAGVGLADWYRVVEILIHLMFAVALFHWFRTDGKAIEIISLAILAAVATYFLVLVVTWNTLADPVSYRWSDHPPLFRNIRHAAYMLCVGMVVAAWALFILSGRLKLFALLVFVLAASMLLWSGGRGGFVAACLGGSFLLLGFRYKDHAQDWRWLLIGILAAFLLSALFPVDASSMGWLSAVFRTGGAGSADQLSSGRLAIWTSLLPHIAERPWFGWGGEGFMAVRESPRFVQAHNSFLQLLIEWGFVGALLAVLAIGRVLLAGGRQVLRNALGAESLKSLVFGIAVAMSLLFLSLVDGIFYHGMPLAFLMAGLACIQAAVRP